MTTILVILFCWYVLAFGDAIRFAKGGEDCYEVWHIAKWVSFWVFPIYIIIKNGVYHNVPAMAVLVVGAFLYNILYRVFRALYVYQLDNKYRIQWLGKILGRKGLI